MVKKINIFKSKISLYIVAILCGFTYSGLFAQVECSMELGNPSNATSDTVNAENYLMVKPQYCLSYNNSKHVPNWVSWKICVKDLGEVKRSNDFRPDSTLPVSWYHVKSTDYSKSGFDRGHQCPSGDRTNTSENNSETFLMTNMIPQVPNNNRITWEHFESYCRMLVKEGNELYIVCGILGQGGTGSQGYATSVKNDIIVPSQIWKIAVVLTEGIDDIKRITTKTRVISVLIPNDQSCSQKKWYEYRVSVDQIESLTGYDFLSKIPVDIQKVIEAKVDNGEIN